MCWTTAAKSTWVLVRVHSECLTADVFGSLRCDCNEQLVSAMAAIEREGKGVLVYMRLEGRGIGLLNKIRAYKLQDQGLDTVEANLALGFRDDERDYAVAAHMLHGLEVRSVRLVTNNPEKIRQLTQHRVKVSGRIPHVIPPNEYNRFYLETKARRSGHLIDLPGATRLAEQSDPVLVAGMPGADEGTALASMGIYVFNTEFLYKILIEDSDNDASTHDFGKDIIPSVIHSNKVVAYPFRDEETDLQGYWRDVGTVESYWQANMDLIVDLPDMNLYDPDTEVRTVQQNLPPVKLGPSGKSRDSLLSNGCVSKAW